MNFLNWGAQESMRILPALRSVYAPTVSGKRTGTWCSAR